MMMFPDFADRDGCIWLDGELVDWREAKVHVLTHSLHYGLGVFEGVRAYSTDEGKGHIFRLEDHTARLLRSAKLMRIDCPWSGVQLDEAQKLVLRENNLEEGYIRPLIFLGSEAIGLRADGLSTRVMVAAWEWPSYLPEETVAKGLALKTAVMRRSSFESGLNKAKVCGQYVQSMLALQDALRSGCDEALVLDANGLVCEGSGENVFCIRGQKISTPRPTACLEGITRDSIMQIARECGFTVVEEDLTVEDFLVADEVFMTGTAAEVMPVASIDGVDIGQGVAGPISMMLREYYIDVVRGRKDFNSSWLSAISQ